MAQRVLIVGSVALDDVTTPHGEQRGILGGSAVYGSVAASNFAPVDIVGIVGDDFPAEHVAALRRRGVNTDGLEVVPGGKTFHWAGEYAGAMNEAVTRLTELGVFEHFNPRIPDAYRADPYVFLANIDPELQLRVLEQVARPRLVIIDSMNLWINIKREALMEVLRRADAALLNDAEACLLCQTHSLPQAVERLLELNLKRIIIKKGSHGAQMFSAEGTFAVPAMPLAVVKDPTGAGDTFAGGLIGYLAMHDRLDEATWRQAILVGTACASFAVEDFSIARIADLTPGRVLERCNRLHEAIACEPVRFPSASRG
jgi:sugar/nucleoside kinase (ribokinase family)